jgi:hypothetical protein
MRIFSFVCSIVLLTCCTNYSQVTYVAKLPKKMKEVSGIEVETDSTFWMLNDRGNKNELYLVNELGHITETIKVDAKNIDWEDLTSDDKGNLYIGDFGNNDNDRKDVVVLKIRKKNIRNNKPVQAERIRFYYPNQTKFPPKKKKRFFDAESFIYFNNSLYIFTKSRVKDNFGTTSVYRVPSEAGNYQAELLGTFDNGSDMKNWITSASISDNGKKLALLTADTVLIFEDFPDNRFFQGKLTKVDLGFVSQKEAIDFFGNNTLFICDERSHGKGGNLYKITID